MKSDKRGGTLSGASGAAEGLGGLGLATFVVDPPTMLIAGLVFAWFCVHVLMPRIGRAAGRKVLFGLCAVFQLAFWILGPLMYWDNPYFAAQGLGNDFMWNGYLLGHKVVTDIPTYHSVHAGAYNAIAVISWLIQPLCLWLGVQLAYILFGRNENQNGSIGLMREI